MSCLHYPLALVVLLAVVGAVELLPSTGQRVFGDGSCDHRGSLCYFYYNPLPALVILTLLMLLAAVAADKLLLSK